MELTKKYNKKIKNAAPGEDKKCRMIKRCRRWSPSKLQRQYLQLKYYFDMITTPDKKTIKEITKCLLQFGQEATEANVYNWFQNQRAKNKRAKTNSAQ